ncbi:MAG: beta-N-acetylhexosaminidase [Parvibaculum sp.]|uniref:beta-N-acetylhexosaminidase n=1 Tax=Parvibaculum sp. TaxID=2024848 RepID=UPI0025F49101|nr:beta-N-acetylhexosaminidase [Parvibaculum sp.]MCE9649325.1 beta-N-acetylhexosaminidase [Parvibaculum sp.]
MPVRAAIYGCAGLKLTDAEKRFFSEAEPWGFIVFARNIETPDQLRALTDEFRDIGGPDVPVLIDQEGGRVARLRPPHWRPYPAGRRYGELYARSREQGVEAARLGSRLIACELASAGINVDCLPVLDVPVPGANDVIGNRAYAETPEPVIALGRAAAEGLLAGGVLPIIKHIPGHGRAGVDSHLSLPIVETDAKTLSETDFAPFKALADMPVAMTAHVVYAAIDAAAPATTSRKVIGDIIRGVIGFDGFLMSDDVSMQALQGSLADRARASLKAGCDIVLHCNGRMDEMEAVAAETPMLAGDALRRSQTALARLSPPEEFDEAAGLARFHELMGTSWG